MPPTRKKRLLASAFSRAGCIVEFLCDRMHEALQVVGGDAADEKPRCEDVEGRGACAFFAWTASVSEKLMAHAAAARPLPGDGGLSGECAPVSARERLTECILRQQACPFGTLRSELLRLARNTC